MLNTRSEENYHNITKEKHFNTEILWDIKK